MRSCWWHDPEFGQRWLCTVTAAGVALHRKRDKFKRVYSACENRSPYVKDGIQRLRGQRQRAKRSIREHTGHQGRGALSAAISAPAKRSRATSPQRYRPRRSATCLRRTSMHLFRARNAEADEFYATDIPPGSLRRRAKRDAPGVRRTAVVQAVLSLRDQGLARRRSRQPPPPPAER